MSRISRRSLLTSASLALTGVGLSKLVLRFPGEGRAHAQEDSGNYVGPYWLFVHASGAWDPMFMFNPTLDPTFNRAYTTMPEVGGFRCAGLTLDYERFDWDPALDFASHVLTPEQFAMRHGARMAVINGVDTATNNHDGGQRAMGSGRLATGYPSLGALIAAGRAPGLPMAYVSAGGYDATMGHLPLTRVANAGAIQRIARPFELSPGNADTERYHTTDTMGRIARMQRERAEAQRERQRLPVINESMRALAEAKAGASVLDRLALPEPVQLGIGPLGDLQGFMQQAQTALATFTSGLTAVASVVLGGFDTHGNHDRDQARQVLKLLGGIDYIVAEAARQGLEDNLYVVVTSDFGRGPHYNGENDGAGKDHWPVTSMLVLGPDIAGGRTLGGTDDDALARGIDPDSLALDDNGMKITPELVHLALRRVAGIEDHELSARYPLLGEAPPLFG
jgi:uncharacterized protein (DUF1501 family)